MRESSPLSAGDNAAAPSLSDQILTIEPPPVAAPRASAGGTEVLVIEDDEAVRLYLNRTLTALGYQVSEAASGREAVGMIGAKSGGFDLVLSDVIMPRMSGLEVYEQVRPDHPDLTFVFMSGYGDEVLPSPTTPERVHFLAKPFTREELVAKLNGIRVAR